MIHAARARLVLAQLGEVDPALAALALWCRHRQSDGPTRTEGETIHYGPGFDLMPLPEQVGLAAHHILHVALRHSDRQTGLSERLGPGFDPTLYGLAADGIVNETLLLAGHGLPRPCVTLTDLLAVMGAPAPSAAAALAEWDTDRLAMRLHRDPNAAKRARAYGRARAFVPDLKPGDAGSRPQDEGEWRGHLQRALQTGREAGTGIGAMLATLADLAPSEIPWEHHLRRLLATALMEVPRASYRRPSSRWAASHAHARATGGPEPIFEPGRQRASHVPRIVVGLDTSGSIDPLTLSLFLAEASAIARRSGAETHLLGFDETVHTERRLAPGGWDLLHGAPMRTGGGTSFVDVMARCQALAPSIAIILTDLEGPHGVRPACPVLWVTRTHAPDPPFGRTLRIPD